MIDNLILNRIADSLEKLVKISEQKESTKYSEKELPSFVAGLIRASEFLEQRDGGNIWDDESREALQQARKMSLTVKQKLNKLGMSYDEAMAKNLL